MSKAMTGSEEMKKKRNQMLGEMIVVLVRLLILNQIQFNIIVSGFMSYRHRTKKIAE